MSSRDDWGATVLHAPAAELVGRRFAVEQQLRFGRNAGEDVDVVIDDKKMSRRHATLARTGLGIEVRDEGSSNGTHVNGQRVSAMVVGDGDIVRMGDTLLEVGPAAPGTPITGLVGRAPAFLAAVDHALRAAGAMPILLLGEPGTGKDVLARHVHTAGGRTGRYVAVSCATLPEEVAEEALVGQLERVADGGTLFLDEIGDLSRQQQVALLAALERHPHALVIAATTADLHAAVAAGVFREDLRARLAGALVRLPPLRARKGDILELAASFLRASWTFSAHAAEALLLYEWRGNIRELRAATGRLAQLQPGGGEVSNHVLDEVLSEGDPTTGRGTQAITVGPPRPAGPDRDELVARLTAARGDVDRMAAEYGKDPKQVQRWLRRHGLDPNDYR